MEFICNPGKCVIETDKGLVRGYFDQNVYQFKGIPYAKAKRFHAPEEADAWRGEFDATTYGYVCPLINPNEKAHDELKVPHRYWPMSENCQNLNVFTPGLDDKKRPVLFWIHGGAYEAGSSIEQLVYEGYSMADRGDVVLVSVNHRLNMLGYFDLSEYGEEYKNSANAGMDDLIMALKWVNRNIRLFGGDPENVTIFGQSGGGAKVTTLLQMPAADGLFHKAMNMSGTLGPFLADVTGSTKEFVDALLEELALSSVKELETVDEVLLLRAYRKLRPIYTKKGVNVGSAPMKNDFYLGNPVEYGFRPESASIPMLIGSTFGEFFSFGKPMYDRVNATPETGASLVLRFLGKEKGQKLLEEFQKAYPERNPGDALTMDSIFRAQEIPYVYKRAALNTSTYVYLFNYDMKMDGSICPWHCADIPYWFANTELSPVTASDEYSKTLETQMFLSLMAFARTGDPNHDGIPKWHSSSAKSQPVMVFDENTRERVDYDIAAVELSADFTRATVTAFMNGMKESAIH